MGDIPIKKKKHVLARVLLTLLILLLVAIAALLCVSLLDRHPVTDALPDGFSAYVRVVSAGDFFTSLLRMHTVDAFLASPETAEVRALLDTLRRVSFLDSRAFRILSDVRMDAALYGSSYLAVADLGIRSAATRLAPFVGPWINVPGLSFSRSVGVSRFTYTSGDTTVYAAVHKNLLLAAGDKALLERSLTMRGSSRDAQTAEILARKPPKDVRFLIHTRELLSQFSVEGTPLGRLLQSLNLPGFAAVDLLAGDSALALDADLAVSSEAPGLKPILAARSKPPAILASLPASTQYFSALSAGNLRDIKDAALFLLDPQVRDAWAKADSAGRLTLGMGMDDLLLSWTGDELGVYGLSGRTEPIFFIKVRDEARRREIFQSVFETGALGEDDAVVLDGMRVPRIVFPWFLRTLLTTLGVDIPQPYCLTEDGYFLLSASAETLVAAVRESRGNKVLPRTDSWRKTSAGIPAASAAMVYYSLNRGVPFFLRGSSPLIAFLKEYGEGVASLRFEEGHLRLALSAVASGDRGTREIPGFPLKAESQPQGGIYAGQGKDRKVHLYWLEDGKTLVAYSPASGERKTLELDDTGTMALETEPDGGLSALWVVSKRGSVWRLRADLSALPGFPVATGARPSAAPTLAPLPAAQGEGAAPRLLIPLKDGGILTVGPDAYIGSLPVPFTDPLTSPVACRGGVLAYYPKSFDGQLWVSDAYGSPLEGWPAPLPGLGYGSPVLAPWGGSIRVAFLTQSGEFCLWDERGQAVSGFPASLEGVFYGTPIFAAGSFWAVSESGSLYRVDMDGHTERLDARGMGGRNPMLCSQDVDKDGKPEIFISGEGNALYGFTANLKGLEGFPVPGTGRPGFADLNGDGRMELLSTGVDGTIRAVSFH